MNINLRLFLAYRIFSRMYFHLPILFLLFWSLQITYAMATVLLAAYSAASTVSSDLAPRLSRMMSLGSVVVLGETLKVFGLVLIVLGTMPGDSSLPLLLAGQLIGGAGFSIALSADGSLLRQVAVGMNQQLLGAIQAKAQSWMFIATLGAGFIGGILYDHQPHWSLFAGIAANCIALAMVALIIQNLSSTEKSEDALMAPSSGSQPPEAPLQLDQMQMTWIGFYSITRAFALAPFIGLLPLHFALQQVDPYLFGLVLGIFTLGGFLVSRYGAQLLARLGLKGTMVSCCGIIASLGMFASSSFFEPFGVSYFTTSLIGISLLGIAAGAIRPSVMSCLDLSNLSSRQKMSVFSSMERFFGYLCASLLLCFGMIVESFSITATFTLTIAVLVLTLVIGLLWLKIAYSKPRRLVAASVTGR